MLFSRCSRNRRLLLTHLVEAIQQWRRRAQDPAILLLEQSFKFEFALWRRFQMLIHDVTFLGFVDGQSLDLVAADRPSVAHHERHFSLVRRCRCHGRAGSRPRVHGQVVRYLLVKIGSVLDAWVLGRLSRASHAHHLGVDTAVERGLASTLNSELMMMIALASMVRRHHSRDPN